MSDIDSFENHLKNEKRYSVHTVTAYVNDIKQFFSFMKSQYDSDSPNEVTATIAKSWIYELSKDKISPRSVNRKLVAMNTFYKFLMKTEIVTKNPLKNVKGPKTEKRLVEWLPEKNTSDLFGEMEWTEDFAGQRDKLIFEFLYGTGVRLSELVALTSARVYQSQKTIKVLGKRNKERIIPMNKSLLDTLSGYMKLREDAGFGKEEFLLLTDKGEHIYPMFVQRLTKKYLSMLSSAKKLSPHVLRHTFATHLLNKGADINAIKELLGHANLAATQVYTHNSIERLKTIYKQAHPKS